MAYNLLHLTVHNMKTISFIVFLLMAGPQFFNRLLTPPPLPEESSLNQTTAAQDLKDESRKIAAFYNKTEWLNRCSIEVDSRIKGKVAGSVIPWRDDTKYLSTSWAYGINLTAVAMAKSSPRPVAITPKHLVSTKHYGWHPWPGQTIRFLTMDNRVISRLVDQVKYLGSSDNTVIDKDIAVIRLTEDLPGSITPMKLIEKNATVDLIQSYCPVLRLDQENKALLVTAYGFSRPSKSLSFSAPYAYSTVIKTRSYAPYYEAMVTGDSSSSSILLYRDQFGLTPFLLSQVSYAGTGAGANHSFLASEIQAVINGFGDTQSKYQLVFGPYEYTGHKPPSCSITATRIGNTSNCSIFVQGSGDAITGNPIVLPNGVAQWTKSGASFSGTATCATDVSATFTAQLTGPGGTGPQCESAQIKPIVGSSTF